MLIHGVSFFLFIASGGRVSMHLLVMSSLGIYLVMRAEVRRIGECLQLRLMREETLIPSCCAALGLAQGG